MPSLVIVLFATALAAGIFLLPWHVPFPRQVESPSYIYGYNNLAAHLVIALALLAALVWQLRRQRALPAEAASQLVTPVASWDRAPLAALGGATLAICAAITTLFHILPYGSYGEMPYFLSRLDLMILGQRPFQDFHFNYGPMMLEPVVALYDLSYGLLSVEQAYLAVLLAHWVIGLWLLWYVVDAFTAKSHRVAIFLLLALATFNLTLGLNYTPLRFLLPLASLVLIDRIVVSQSPAAWKKACALSFLLPLACFSISPEMGIASFAAFLVYFSAHARARRGRPAPCLLFVALTLPAVVLLFSREYFDIVFSFVGGGNNLPILPTAHVLLFLLAVFAVLPRLGGSALLFPASAPAPLSLALFILLGLCIPAALGRCDPGHILFYGLALFLLFLREARDKPRDRIAVLVAFFLAFPVAGQISFWNSYAYAVKEILTTYADLRRVAHADKTVPAAIQRLSPSPDAPRVRYSKLLPWNPELLRLLRYPRLGTPMGVSEQMDRFLKLTGQFIPEYHPGFYDDVLNKADIAQKIRDLRRMPVIVFAGTSLSDLAPFDEAAFVAEDNRALSRLLLFPLHLKMRNTPLGMKREVMTVISAEYAVREQIGPYFVAVRKDALPAVRQ